MKLLRDTLLLRALCRLFAGRRNAVRRPYTVTVPAPLEQLSGNNVIELHRRSAVADSRLVTHAQAEPLPSSVHLALVSSR
jgi:hypothetical protein